MSSRRVAVIDDDPKIRSVIRRSLEPEGFSVDEANDAAGLFRLMQHESYALITLDISLPDGDGSTWPGASESALRRRSS
jgi:two-component system phosphate regulon response regulator OmpR